jgi:two-component system, sensor histidine kinase PdtaS
MTDDIQFDPVIRQVAEAVPNAMMVLNRNGRVVMINAHAEVAFGYSGNEILGWPIEQLVTQRVPGRTPPVHLPFLVNAWSAPTGDGHELYASHKDGHDFLVEVGQSRIETNDGPLVILGITDISERRQEAARIRAALTEKDILLGEIHHRVKNNLQIVCSLLDLQAARVSDQATRDLLRDSQNRIHSMALIHQTSYGSTDFESVDFAQFSETLLSLLIRSYGIDANRIAIHVDVEPLRLPIDVAVPCGLVVNELITNAFKHAFANRDHGEIRIALTRLIGNEVLLSVSDNGVGLPDQVDTRTTETIGLQLVHLLALQLDGEITIHRSNPTRFSLRFQI